MVRIFNSDNQTLIGKCKEQEKEQKMSELAETYAEVDVDLDGDIVVSNDD